MLHNVSRFVCLNLLGGLTLTLLTTPSAEAASITGYNFIGQGTIPQTTSFSGTTVGGFSGLSYSGSGNRYYGISDDPNNIRFYGIDITINQSAGTVLPTVKRVTTLKNSSGTALVNGRVDGEGIAVVGSNVFISSEGTFNGSLATLGDFATLTNRPFINRFALSTGNQNLALTLPSRYTTSTATSGLRSNLSFESLTITPNTNTLFSAIEGPLKQDQSLLSFLPTANGGLGNPPLNRLLRFNKSGNTYVAGAEFLYKGDSGHGLVDLLAMDSTTLLSLERGNLAEPYSIRVYQISLGGATNISSNGGLAGKTTGIKPVSKTLLFDLKTLLSSRKLSTVSNFEGLTFGPNLPNGDLLLLLVSDNNFEKNNASKFAAFALKTSSTTARFSSVLQTVPEPSSLLGLGLIGGLGILKTTTKLFKN